MNDMFALHTFGIVATLVALATYTTVFNINNLVIFMQKRYDKFKATTLHEMGKDADEKWQDCAGRFWHFRPERGSPVPTEWLVVWYRIRQALRRGWWLGRRDGAAGASP